MSKIVKFLFACHFFGLLCFFSALHAQDASQQPSGAEALQMMAPTQNTPLAIKSDSVKQEDKLNEVTNTPAASTPTPSPNTPEPSPLPTPTILNNQPPTDGAPSQTPTQETNPTLQPNTPTPVEQATQPIPTTTTPAITAPNTPAPSTVPGSSTQNSTNVVIGAFTSNENEEIVDEATINFDNAALSSVVYALGERKKINIIPSKALEGINVSLTTHTSLTLDRAWNILLTLLELNGFTLINVGNTYRIVASANNQQEPLPVYTSTTTSPEQLPASDLVVRYAYFFKNIKAEVAAGILGQMVSDSKNVIFNKDLNACIIKDQCLTIKAAMRIVKELDEGGLREAIEVIPLKYASADTIQNLFKDILGTEGATDQQRIIRFTPFQQKEMTYFASGTKVLSEPIKNQVIVLGVHKNVERIKNFIIKYLDIPMDNADSRLHVKDLRYIKAEDLKNILEKIIAPPAGTTQEKALVMEGGYKVFEDVMISAETDSNPGEQPTVTSSGAASTTTPIKAVAHGTGNGNRIVVACNKEDWKRILAFIEQLDKPQPQVALEIMIVDVNLFQAKALGFQMRDLAGKPFGHNVNGIFENLLASNVFRFNPDGSESATGNLLNINANYARQEFYPSSITFGPAGTNTTFNNIWGVLIASLQSSNAQIISQPYVIVNNHQQSNINIQKTLRVTGGLDLSKTTIGPTVHTENLSATINITITPHINLVGNVDLDINIDINQFRDPSTTGAQQSQIILIRNVATKASMGSGEVLGLGGFTTSTQSESIYKTPVLGDIPLIGNLFRFKSKDKTEQNIYVFIRPSIIKPRFEGAPDEYTQLKLDYAKLQIMKNDTYISDRDPVQRWFFKPTNQSIKHRVEDAARGVLRPIDDYTYGKDRPKCVSIQDDPYYQTKEIVKQQRAKEAILREEQEKHLQASNGGQKTPDQTADTSSAKESLPQQPPLVQSAHA